MLRDALPEILTKTLPGPKSAAMIARREAAVPSAIHCGYPVAMGRAEGAIIEGEIKVTNGAEAVTYQEKRQA